MANKVYGIIQKKVIKNIEEQIKEMQADPTKKFSWVKPWGRLGMPFNDNLGRYYTGVNTLLLEKGGAYLSEKQLKEKGYTLKENAEKHMVIFWTFRQKKKKEDDEDSEILDEKSSKNMVPVLRYYTVYHESDIIGFERRHHKDEGHFNDEVPTDALQDYAIDVLNSYCEKEGIHLNITETNEACYIPSKDEIKCPLLNQFKTAGHFLSTIAHESVHSTGAEKRLNRDIQNHFGSKDYSKEELVAEIGASMYLSIMGVESEDTERNSVAYISGWLSKLKDDVNLITSAAQRAQKAVNYILQYDKNNLFEKDQDEYKAPEAEATQEVKTF